MEQFHDPFVYQVQHFLPMIFARSTKNIHLVDITGALEIDLKTKDAAILQTYAFYEGEHCDGGL